MTLSILGQLDQKIRDAIDGARSAGTALARSAHEILDCAHPETTATAVGTSGRSDLIDRETVRVLLTGANLSRIDGMLSAYGVVLRLLDDARIEEASAARGRVEQEAKRDAQTFVAESIEKHETPRAYAIGAFEAWLDDDPEAADPLTRTEAQEIYMAAFFAAVEGAS